MADGDFAFRVEDVLTDLYGVNGVVLIGPEVSPGVLSVGDRLTVPTSSGQAETTCTGFPLIPSQP